MKARFFIAMATALVLCGTMVGKATASYEIRYRVPHGDSDCLHGWWNNNPPPSAGFFIGTGQGSYTYGVQSFCSQYGTVTAKVDQIDDRDFVHELNHGDKVRSQDWGDIRDISCCLDTSDLCFKKQVEKNSSNRITSVTISGSTITGTSVDVGSHTARYEFCADNPNDIYCRNDPEGDAFDDPYTGECDGRACSIQDCLDNYNDNPAADICTSIYLNCPPWTRGDHDMADLSNWVLENNNCVVSGLGTRDNDCTIDGVSYHGFNMWDGTDEDAFVSTVDVNVHDMTDMRVCQPGSYYRGHAGACP